MSVDEATTQQTFWGGLELPADLRLSKQDSVVVPRTGPGGAAVIDVVSLQAPAGRAELLAIYRSPLLARDVPSLKRLLSSVADQRRARALAAGRAPAASQPAIATDAATPSVVQACLREGVALLDRRGTVLVHSGPVFVHVEGRGRVERPHRGTPFRGKSARIVRVLLASPGETFKGQELAARAGLSYVHAHGVLTRLERDGYVSRRSPRSGFRLTDPAGLLRAWIDSGDRTAVAIEAFNAPSTMPEALARADEARREAGVRGIFTLASALLPEEVFASGLPHGVYLAGEAEPVVRALKLRRITPHNFLVLRAEPLAETEQGGLYLAPRTLPYGEGVAVPQLAVDLASAGGRGPEQARHLIERYAESLPLAAEEP